jgi:hypothetical protein
MKQESFPFDQRAVQVSLYNIITQSEIMTRAACPRKWYYRYALMLDRRGVPNYHIIYGSLMHGALARLYGEGLYVYHPRGHPIEVPQMVFPKEMLLAPGVREEIEFVRAKVQIAFNAYRWHYHGEDCAMKVVSTETDYEVVWRGMKLTGRIDLVAHPKLKDGIFIWDFKTAGRFDAQMLDAWSFRFQFLFYCWLYWRATGIRPMGTMANGLLKTQLKISQVNKKTKEKESREAYLARVKDDFWAQRPKFFYRQRMPLQTGMLERFEKEMLDPHINMFRHMRSSKVNPSLCEALSMSMNTGHCHIYGSFCEFLPLCKDGPLMLAEYDTREVKHEELLPTETPIE